MSIRTAAGASLLALACSASPAMAQTPPARPARPYRGLFGGGQGNTEQLLQLTASTDGGYDTNVLAGSTPNGDTGTGVPGKSEATAGPFGQFTVGVEYTLNRKRVGFAAIANTAQRFYSSQASNGLLGTYSGGLSGWFHLAKKTRLSVDETSWYQPFLSYSYFPVPSVIQEDEIAVPDVAPQFDLAVGHQTQTRNAITASLTQQITSRSSVSVGGSYDVTQSSGNAIDLTSYSANARYTIQLAKGLGVHAGYGYQEGRYSGSLVASQPSPVFHNIDIGIDYNRPLSFSRRATISFATGSAAIQDYRGTSYHMIGNANFKYELNRTWLASLGYSRDTQFLQNLRQPVFSDSLSAGLHGLFSRRFEFGATASASRGIVGVLSADNFSSYFGTVSLTTGLTRTVALHTSYSYFRSTFDRTVDLPGVLQPNLARQTVQAGLSFQLPILSRARRPDAPR
jgi:hypothetical protein